LHNQKWTTVIPSQVDGQGGSNQAQRFRSKFYPNRAKIVAEIMRVSTRIPAMPFIRRFRRGKHDRGR
jgi:hypothetical protein